MGNLIDSPGYRPLPPVDNKLSDQSKGSPSDSDSVNSRIQKVAIETALYTPLKVSFFTWVKSYFFQKASNTVALVDTINRMALHLMKLSAFIDRSDPFSDDVSDLEALLSQDMKYLTEMQKTAAADVEEASSHTIRQAISTQQSKLQLLQARLQQGPTYAASLQLKKEITAALHVYREAETMNDSEKRAFLEKQKRKLEIFKAEIPGENSPLTKRLLAFYTATQGEVTSELKALRKAQQPAQKLSRKRMIYPPKYPDLELSNTEKYILKHCPLDKSSSDEVKSYYSQILKKCIAHIPKNPHYLAKAINIMRLLNAINMDTTRANRKLEEAYWKFLSESELKLTEFEQGLLSPETNYEPLFQEEYQILLSKLMDAVTHNRTHLHDVITLWSKLPPGQRDPEMRKAIMDDLYNIIHHQVVFGDRRIEFKHWEFDRWEQVFHLMDPTATELSDLEDWRTELDRQ